MPELDLNSFINQVKMVKNNIWWYIKRFTPYFIGGAIIGYYLMSWLGISTWLIILGTCAVCAIISTE